MNSNATLQVLDMGIENKQNKKRKLTAIAQTKRVQSNTIKTKPKHKDSLSPEDSKKNSSHAQLVRDYAYAIVTSTENPLVVLTHTFKIEYANPSFYKKFNISKSDIPGLFFTHIGNNQFNKKQLKIALSEVWTEGTDLKNFEFIYSFSKIGERVLHLNARTIQEPNSPDRLILLTITDTAAQKRKRRRSESLYAERTRFHELLMQAPALITVLHGPDLVHDFVNPKFIDAIGKHRSMLGKPIRKSIPELSDQGFFEILENVYKTGKPYLATEKLLKIDRKGSSGRENIYLNLMCQSYRNEFDEIDGVLVYAIDVTEQFNIRKINNQSEEKYRILLKSIQEGFCIAEVIFDENKNAIDLQFIEINTAGKRILNISDTETKYLSDTPTLKDTPLLNVAGEVAISPHAGRFVIHDANQNKMIEVYCSKIESTRKHIVAIVLKPKNEQSKTISTIHENEVNPVKEAQNSTDGIIMVDKEWRIHFVNEVAQNILRPFQTSGLEFVDQNLWQNFPSLLPSDIEKKIHKASTDQKITRTEIYNKSLSKWFELTIQPTQNYLSLIFVDITQRKKREENLLNEKFKAQVTDQNLANLFINAPAILAILSADDLVFEMVNSAFQKFVGIRNSVIGLSIVEAFPGIDPFIVKIIVNVIKKGKAYTANEFPLLYDWDNNGLQYKKFLNVSLVPVFDENKKITGVICFGYEITEQITNKEQLEELSRSKDIFISIASHELKTPLTSIKAYSQILERRFNKIKDTDSALVIGKMDTQLDKLNTLITNLLDVTKIEEGKLTLNGLCFDFNVLVGEIMEEMQLTTKKNIISKLQKGAFVCGDRERIGQVMINFISNAIKYSPGSKKIVISTKQKDNQIIFSVKDFGMGIAKIEQDKVFERFHRISRKNGETYPGLGLGLYIASQIVTRLNGKIWLKSKFGSGSTFYFSLPAEKNLF